MNISRCISINLVPFSKLSYNVSERFFRTTLSMSYELWKIAPAPNAFGTNQEPSIYQDESNRNSCR